MEEEPRDSIYAVPSPAERQSRQGFLLPWGPGQLFLFPPVKQAPASAVGVRAAPRLQEVFLRVQKHEAVFGDCSFLSL